MSENRSGIKITSDLVNKLLSGELIEIYNEEGMSLPPEEGEILRDIVYAKVRGGIHSKVISIFLEKEVVGKGIGLETYEEVYHEEELYRLPYNENQKWLTTSLELAQQQWATSFANDIEEL